MLVSVAAVYPAEPPRAVGRLAGVGAILNLLRGANYPTVVEILPGSAAAADGRLAVGDEIVAVAPDGNESGFIELKGLPLAEIVALMRGPEGTSVALKVRPRERTTPAGVETVVSLTRKMLTLPPPDPGTRISGARSDFLGADPWLTTTQVTFVAKWADKRGCVQPDYLAWEKVTNGMSKEQVSALLGPPLDQYDFPGMTREEAKALLGPTFGTNEVTAIPPQAGWTYGWLGFDSKTFPEAFLFRIRFSDGKVHDKEDPFGGKLSRGKPAVPGLINPAAGQIFDHYPRWIDFRWMPSSGLCPVEYVVQMQTKMPVGWSTNEFNSDQPYHCAAFAGAQMGRWRVKARNSMGESEWSEYREFEFRQ
jgi:hypothetical protein